MITRRPKAVKAVHLLSISFTWNVNLFEYLQQHLTNSDNELLSNIQKQFSITVCFTSVSHLIPIICCHFSKKKNAYADLG